MTRHEIRECMFCLLFQNDFHEADEFEEQCGYFLEQKPLSGKQRREMVQRLGELIRLLPEIDGQIEASSRGWKLDRIAKAELAILRLAVFEARYDDNVPVGVAINEAVELAKAYGDDNAPSFVNGILGKIVNE